MSNKIIPRINFAQKEASRQIFPNSPILSSHHTNWTDISLEYHQQPATDTGEFSAPVHYIGILVSGIPTPLERWLDGCFQKQLTIKGDAIILPAGIVHRCCWKQKAYFMLLSLKHQLLERVGEEIVNTDSIQLIPHAPPVQDLFLLGIAVSLKQELQTSAIGGSLYVDQLKSTLAIHLLRKYCSYQPIIREYTDGLPPYKLRQALDYIHAHLEQNIKLADIAATVGMSQFYFCRLFRQSMGVAPHKYIIQQRLERAKQLLNQQPELSIADIALRCGFTHQSHLAKYFRQIIGTTPKKYRQIGEKYFS